MKRKAEAMEVPEPFASLQQEWPLPTSPKPIVIIGAGSIIKDAHLPAYRKAGFQVQGIYDTVEARARKLATDWDIPNVYTSVGQVVEAGRREGAVFDVAVPPKVLYEVISQLPDGCAALLQKPLGTDASDATRICAECRRRRITACVNFQLRFTSMMLATRDAVSQGLLGDLVDVNFDLNINTPWHHFEFIKGLEHVEIPLHSIHYLDLIRSFIGEPTSVHAKTLTYPGSGVGTTRTSAILDYGEKTRCCLTINHHYSGPERFSDALVRLCGTKGSAVIRMGLLLNYPVGVPDELHFRIAGVAEAEGKEGLSLPLKGSWFPDAFIGTMSNLQRFVAGEDKTLHTAVDDAWGTMALVDACLQSSAQPGTLVAKPPA